MTLTSVLTELCAVPAPSGAEAQLAALLEERWTRCEAVRRDPVGNVIAKVGGSGPRVLVQAHMDDHIVGGPFGGGLKAYAQPAMAAVMHQASVKGFDHHARPHCRAP